MSFRGAKCFLRVALLAVVTGSLIGTSIAQADDSARKIKSRVNPAYPALAKRMSITGTVKVEVVVAANGSVKSTKVIGGHPLLIEPAIDAVKQWKYEPAAAETTSMVVFHFTDK